MENEPLGPYKTSLQEPTMLMSIPAVDHMGKSPKKKQCPIRFPLCMTRRCNPWIPSLREESLLQ